jgi:hypothetical protein
MGQKRPVKAKSMFLGQKKDSVVFFDSQGAIYFNHILKGAWVNSMYIRIVLRIFMKVVKKKRPNGSPSILRMTILRTTNLRTTNPRNS